MAFRVGLFGLEMARPPANTKPLEVDEKTGFSFFVMNDLFIFHYSFLQVKLAHQESELVGLLKRIPLGPAELAMVRQRAEQLRDGVLRSRGHALLPIMLASFIFDALNAPSMPFFFLIISSEIEYLTRETFHAIRLHD